MLFTKLACASALSSVAYAAAASGGGDDATSLTLNPADVNLGSEVTGGDSVGASAGQALAVTSVDNFINFCDGKTITDGFQILDGSCNPTPMGDIPAKTNMISTIILTPTTSDKPFAAANEDFNVTLQVINLQAGLFSDADATYYTNAQTLNGDGNVMGHQHVTIQDMGADLNPQVPMDPTVFAFFHGIDDAGNGKGLLTAVVSGGLPAGNYRVCTIAGTVTHNPPCMPVAQRGTVDDCTKFTISGEAGTPNPASNAGSGGAAAAALAASAIVVGAGKPNPDTSVAAVAAASSTSVAAGVKGGKGGATTAAAGSATAAVGKGGKAVGATTAATTATAAASTGKATAAAGGSGKAFGGGAAGGKPVGGKGGKGRKQRARREFIA